MTGLHTKSWDSLSKRLENAETKILRSLFTFSILDCYKVSKIAKFVLKNVTYLREDNFVRILPVLWFEPASCKESAGQLSFHLKEKYNQKRQASFFPEKTSWKHLCFLGLSVDITNFDIGKHIHITSKTVWIKLLITMPCFFYTFAYY